MNRRSFVSRLATACVAVQAIPGHSAMAFDVRREEAQPADQLGVGSGAPAAIALTQVLFPLTQIRLLSGPFAAQQETNRKYLLKLEPDRLLSCFRAEAGLPPMAPPYRGWESEQPLILWGHILGFYMSGAGMMVQATDDAVLRNRLNYIVDELAAIQQANGSGYMLSVPGGKKLFADVAAGNFEITHASPTYGFEINNVFEPTYTWNKLTLGLYQVYLATGNPKAKAVLQRTADWFGQDVLDHLSDDQVQHLLFCEHGSIHESMLCVYTLTNDPKYLKWARRLCFDRLLSPLAAGNGAFITGYHANCSIPVFTGFERIYQTTGEQQLHTAAVNFVNEVVDHRSWANGGNSASEHFFAPAEFEQKLHAPAGPESCNSVNMLRLIEATYATAPEPRLMDQYESILWNHLLTAHEPERGMFVYYTPMQPGSYRVYSDEFDSMWCCVGTGMESPGKYGQMIYTHSPDGRTLDVNLFIASELDWVEQGLRLRQVTDFPEKPSTTLRVVRASGKEKRTLRVRHPGWVPINQLRLTLNDKPVAVTSQPGDFAEVEREWKSGDKLVVDFPMELRASPLPHSTSYAALLYGPILLSAQLGTEGLVRRDFWALLNQSAQTPPISEDHFPRPSAATAAELVQQTTAVADGPLQFAVSASGSSSPSIHMVPMYRNHFQRYAIYLKLNTPQAMAAS